MNNLDTKKFTENKTAYEKKYGEAGYGLTVPDGHIIRIYKHIIEYELGIKGGAVLDFGAGNGTHLAWIGSQGSWELYGVDISEIAIKQAQSKFSQANFSVTGAYPDLIGMYGQNKFDLIMANQSLYYVDNKELTYLIDQFYQILKPGGAVYASMSAEGNYYYDRSEPTKNEDLRRVTLVGRVNETTYINFKTREQILEDFSKFRKVQAGYYDTVIREDEGSTKHWFFVGQK